MITFLLIVALIAPNAGRAIIVTGGTGSDRVVALSFDAGADRGYASRILATLEHNHIHGSFGMTGLWAKANPDLVRRMVRDHDVLINHTYDHSSFTGYSTHTPPLTTSERTWEITTAAGVIRRITGHSPKPYFRPPYGDYDAATLTLIRRLGYRYMVMWTIDSLGWDHLPKGGIIHRCLTLVHPGAIILMHVGAQSQDALALPTVIKQLRKRGYHFVTIAQLVGG